MLDIIIKSCPICKKKPKIYRDHNYEAMGYGAWCTIKCKPLFGKTHLKVEVGKASWNRAYKEAVEQWNEKANVVGAQEE